MIFTADDILGMGGSERSVESYVNGTPRTSLRMERMAIAALAMTGAITLVEQQQLQGKIDMSEYKHTVVAEASGPSGVYQRITLEQFYETHDQQVANQETLFTGVVVGVTDALKAHRDANV